jgi:hypothetical protein
MTKIYLFNNSSGETDSNFVYAMADTGEVLAEHLCSHIGFMRGDLHDRRPERQKEWKEKFGDYKIVELKQGKTPPKDVIEKNRILGEKYRKEQSNGKNNA